MSSSRIPYAFRQLIHRHLLLPAILAACVLLFAGCRQLPDPAAGSAHTPSQSPTTTIPTQDLATRKPTVKPSPTLTPSETPTTQPSGINRPVCSPLDGIELAELVEIVSFAYDPPPSGRDDGHHGIDFSYYRRGDQASIQGLPVRSVLPGTIAAIIEDRPPYGNMLIIETPLSLLPEGWPARLDLPQPQPPLPENPRLTCPPVDLPGWESAHRSLYLLYAHLDQPPSYIFGDVVDCGEVIGAVGNSGMSGNPHLHLEVRIGPSGAAFPALAHYDNAASPEEMGYYCAWRVSGLFQMIDPLAVLLLAP